MKRFSLILCCLIVSLALFMGCNRAQSTSGGKSGTYKFAFLPNTQNNTFQVAMSNTFKRLCDEKGYGYTCFDPDFDLNIQLNQFADVANQKYDAVFVIPVDSAGIRQGLQQMKERGIPVINVDTPVVDGDLDLVKTIIATDGVNAGQLVGEEMVRRHPNGAKIAILDFPQNESCVNRVKGFLRGIEPIRNKVTIVAQQDAMGMVDLAMPLTEDILQANPDVEVFFCINDLSALGVAAVLKARGKTGIDVYAIDGSPIGKEALVDGSITTIAAQVPIKTAEASFQAALDLLAGKEIPREIMLPSFLVSIEQAKATLTDWQ